MDQILQLQENLTFTSQALKNRVASIFSAPHRFIWELPLPQLIRMFGGVSQEATSWPYGTGQV